MYPAFAINNQTKRFLEMQYTSIRNENTVNINKRLYFKLPYIGNFSNATKIKLIQICVKYCKNTNIVVVFSPIKVGSFSVSVPKFLQSCCLPDCNACYISETKC